jgi:undecaprenyl-diphosphatase
MGDAFRLDARGIVWLPTKGGKQMRTNYAIWLGLIIFAALATLSTKYFACFPGDVAVEKWVQSLVPPNLGWAEGVSQTAEFPWILFILALICILSWTLAGWRAARLSILNLVGMWALGNWLGPVIARPRPSPEMVQVFRPLKGSSFPSLFALRYAATFGFLMILAIRKTSGALRPVLLTGCGALLILGFVARVALAAHWPSDVIISYLIGLLWAACLVSLAFAPDRNTKK